MLKTKDPRKNARMNKALNMAGSTADQAKAAAKMPKNTNIDKFVNESMMKGGTGL